MQELGKTTTMAAKVKYLVDKKNVKPEEIIVISYTHKAIEELQDRINKKLQIPVKITTFHALGYEMIKKFEEKTPEVNYSSYKIISEMIEKTVYKDRVFMKNLILFMGYYFDLTDDVLKFENIEQYHKYKVTRDYETLKSNLGEYIKTIENSRKKWKRTLTGEYLRSEQEVQIANFLYLHGINYEYEKIYPGMLLGTQKQYTPDFFITQGEHEAYIEHFGINQNKTSNIYDAASLAKYINAIKQKEARHKAGGTTLIETWSSYKDGRSLLTHLAEELRKNGFVLALRDLNEVYAKISQTSKDKYITRFVFFMMEFIEHYKTLGYGQKGFDILKSRTDNERTLLFLELAQQVYMYYQQELKRRNQIDFADMINEGNFYLKELERQNIKLPFKYIIIDEFQDIAKQRFDFTKRLAKITDAKVIAVGDDWQSIYAFAGSDITLFTKFIELMGSGTELKITHTYRNSQELIDIAGNFVQKNSAQIKKRLISPKHIEKPIVLKMFYDRERKYAHLAECVNEIIGEILEEYGPKSSILLLGRYKFDKKRLLKSEEFIGSEDSNTLRSRKYPMANLTFLTVHSAKGLGFDNVIILNTEEGKFGFPSQIEDDPIMRLVIQQDYSMEFAEERRLMYVALTRTKNHVYLAVPQNKPSRFLLELIKDYKLEHPEGLNKAVEKQLTLKCPICGYPLKYELNKNYGINLYMCTNDPEVCDFMTNSKECMKDIFACNRCKNGYMIVKLNKNGQYFYGCTNYDEKIKCKNTISIKEELV